MKQDDVLIIQEETLRSATGGDGGGVAAGRSAVSWGAIFGGAVAAAGLSLILLFVGAGLGLSTVSPWTNHGASAAALGIGAIVWLSFTQLAASAVGGYLTGRLRTAWTSVHTHEVYFRDTAHGFLAWAAATLFTAAVFASAAGSVLSNGLQAGATVAGSAASGAASAAAGAAASNAQGAGQGQGAGGESGPMGYLVDRLFRTTGGNAPAGAGNAGAGQSNADANAEIGRIYMNAARGSGLTGDDIQYAGQLVARRTGLSQQEAEKRVTDTYAALQAKLQTAANDAKNAADKARKASAYTALWFAITLFIGAFAASFAATYGGRRRDLAG